MTFSIWALVIGLMFIMMALAGSLMKRLPVSASMFYLAVAMGWGLPAGGRWSRIRASLPRSWNG